MRLPYRVRFEAPLPIGNDSAIIYATSIVAARTAARELCRAKRWKLKSVTLHNP